MGRNETNFLANISCDSMETQTMKVRPGLLKRKNLDPSEPLKHSNHPKKTKSQQVRFKEDSTNINVQEYAELELRPDDDTLLINGNTEKCHNRSMFMLSCPKSQRELQNIAVQTSPCLRKHLSILKAKKVTENPLNEISPESSRSKQLNGDFSREEIVTQLSGLRIAEQLDVFKRSRSRCPFKQMSKAQSNGPIRECSGIEITETYGRATVSNKVPDNPATSTLEGFEDETSNLETDHTIQVSLERHGKCNFTEPTDYLLCSSKHGEPKTQELNLKQTKVENISPLKDNLEGNQVLTLTHSLNSSLSYCFHSENQQAEKSKKVLEGTFPSKGNQIATMYENAGNSQRNAISEKGLEKNTTQSEPQINSNAEDLPCSLQNETLESNESKEGNPGHQAHGGFCSLQSKLQSIEESLQSNQEKIKILLNVIQDLEKARALSEGRNFYRTGQDLNNCSTCRSTACIIYSVEYDFRQQEGRFHQVLKMLDRGEQCPVRAPIQKPDLDNATHEKQDIRKKSKKLKKKCFWWI
ncbi:protein INSYN2B [Spea bombifrons]|uniref:protein INSYN2B n=1 Tax=Spea bombifrons TaxID=233779 RepID=UPI0023498EA2|nr:protein INSYN2B [Spea bombifrons]